MSTERQRKSLERMTPEQKARVEAIRAANKTPERQAEMASVRKRFEDRPSRAELIRRGEIDPDRGLPMGTLVSLYEALESLKQLRLKQGVTAAEVEQRAGIASAAMSRLESGRNTNPTFETLARYAAALGAQIQIHIATSPTDERDSWSEEGGGGTIVRVSSCTARSHGEDTPQPAGESSK